MGPNEVINRTGLSRRQLRYLEERNVLGNVLRVRGRRAYTPEQVELLERLGRLRQLGVGIEEAALIAAASVGRPGAVGSDRLLALVRTAVQETHIRARTASELSELLERERAADRTAGASGFSGAG